jgi:hypothetical protein
LSRLLVALLATLSRILLLLTRLLILLAALVLLAALIWITHVVDSFAIDACGQSPLADDASTCAYLKRIATTKGCAVQTTADRS